MNTILISYDLGLPETSNDYRRLTQYFERYALRAKPLWSVWMIVTSKSVTEIRDEISPLLDGNDRLLVIDVSKKPAAWRNISSPAGDWIKANL